MVVEKFLGEIPGVPLGEVLVAEKSSLPCEPEVGNLDGSLFGYEQVFRLDI